MPRCDVIVGPGNAYVTEAKRQVMGEVAIDGLAGPERGAHRRRRRPASRRGWPPTSSPRPSTAPAPWACLADIGGDARRAASRPQSTELAAELGIATDNVAIVACPDREAAVALSNAFAPEHLELHCADAAALVPQIRNAGAVFVGPHAATAFADYAAGSNHVLPTGGSARFAQGLSVVRLPEARGRRRARRRRGRRPGGARRRHRRRRGPARARPVRTPASGVTGSGSGGRPRRACRGGLSGAGVHAGYAGAVSRVARGDNVSRVLSSTRNRVCRRALGAGREDEEAHPA